MVLNYSNFKTSVKALGVLGLGIYLYDCYNVWVVYKEEMDFVENMELTEEDEKRFESFYQPIDPEGHEISSDKKTFTLQLEQVHELKEIEKKIVQVPAERERAFKLVRESILMLGGGRAAFLQTAHPYVGSGVAQHSDIKNSVHKRFIMTFRHVFAITFGGWEQAQKSALTVRRLHDKVVGEIKEDLGFFKKGHRYSADNMHALYWVHQTLVEGAVFVYEMIIGRLTEEEKQAHCKAAFLGAAAFGIPPSEFPQTYKEFKIDAAKFMKSPILTVGSDSRDIERFLLSAEHMNRGRKPRLSLVLAAQSARWLTFMMLPRNMSQQYFHKVPNTVDVAFFVMVMGMLRFGYRFVPGSVRYVVPYYTMLERNGVKSGFFLTKLNQVKYAFSKRTIATVFPSAVDLKKKSPGN